MKQLPHLRLFARNLNLLLDQSDMTDSELAIQLGVGNSSVSRWARAETFPSTQNFEDLCNYFKVSPKFFFDHNANVHISEVMDDVVELYTPECLVCHRKAPERVSVAKDTRLKNKRLFAVVCDDPAMDGLIHNPSICYINPDLEPKSGSIALVQIASDDLPIFRQYTKGGSTVILSAMSLSEDIEDIILKSDEIHSILGVVVESRTQYVV